MDTAVRGDEFPPIISNIGLRSTIGSVDGDAITVLSLRGSRTLGEYLIG